MYNWHTSGGKIQNFHYLVEKTFIFFCNGTLTSEISEELKNWKKPLLNAF
jgi:hypothetical protein